jgi:aminopeptidase N
MSAMSRKPLGWILTLGLFFGPPSASSVAADTYVRQPGIDARHYIFRLTLLTGDSNEIQGETTATFRLVADGVREIVLDFASLKADGKGMTVTAVTSTGRAVAFSHRDNHLRLPVPAEARAGQDVSYTIAYHGVPANGLRLLDNIHGERTAFSENWYNEARQWLPTIDHPADKATGEFIVTTRADYQVIANGALVEQEDLATGRRRTHWKESVPISSWLYALGIARFAVRHVGDIRGVPLEYWVFPQDVEKGFPVFEKDARGAFEFFSDRIGPYAYEKLAHVQAAGMGGGIENASNIFYGEKGIAAGGGPVVHETAHQWFGDSVTESDWNDVWLSEASRLTSRCSTRSSRAADAFVDGVRRSRDAIVSLERRRPTRPSCTATSTKAARAQQRVRVSKGGWTLHMLRDAVGTETFWRGIRDTTGST